MQKEKHFLINYIYSISFLLIIACNFFHLHNEINCFATEGSGSGYPVILKAGFDIDNPDCKHTKFGPHISQTYDDELQKNVFVFHSHIKEDNDRCKNNDRTRIEIKGSANSPNVLQHKKNETSYYRWKFKLPNDYLGSTDFCHIFQTKVFGLKHEVAPLITLTTRIDVLQLIHNKGKSTKNPIVLKEVNLTPFKGKWIEGYIKLKHSETGELEIYLKELKTGKTLLTYKNKQLDLWRKNGKFNRPKWGLVRKKSNDLKNEKILFADFCVSENGNKPCPSAILGEPCKILSADSFDENYGQWNDGGTDCTRIADKANSGTHSVLLRDNTKESNLTSKVFDLSEIEELIINFSFISNNFDNGEKFYLEISTDGGSQFEKIKQYYHGRDFINNSRLHESISISNIKFSKQTIIRFVVDASTNDDLLYIDDILLEGC